MSIKLFATNCRDYDNFGEIYSRDFLVFAKNGTEAIKESQKKASPRATYWSAKKANVIGDVFIIREDITEDIEKAIRESEKSANNAAAGYDEGFYVGRADAFEETLKLLKGE